MKKRSFEFFVIFEFNMSNSFRKDINSLRAIAVIPVLLFHAGVEMVKGGFLGVDVFFVISGFLITSQIIRNIKSGKFSFLEFWNKRIRRIFPALLVTIGWVTISAYCLMLPYDLKNYGQSVVASVLSANNILLFLTSGYWSLAAEFKPLHHTWSLAVEDQYYLVIPILVFVTVKLRSLLLSSFFIIFSTSFLISFASSSSEFNFLIISHRMWELMAGSFIAGLLNNSHKKSNRIAFLGLAMILISYVYPYWLSTNQAVYSLLPVLGTCLVIVFCQETGTLVNLLESKILQFLGNISYSVYLVHLPILVFGKLLHEGKLSTLNALALVLLAIPIGFLNWKYIELPFRYLYSKKKVYVFLAILATGELVVGLLMHVTYGFQSLSKFSYGSNPQYYCDSARKYSKQKFDTNKYKILVIGNSFGRDIINALVENLNPNEYEFVYQDNILKEVKESSFQEQLLKSADLVLVVSSSGMANRIPGDELVVENANIKKLLDKSCGEKYLVIGTKNFGYNNNFIKTKTLTIPFNYRVDLNQSNIVADEIEQNVWGEKYVSVLSLIKTTDNKVPMFTPEGEFISFDTDHLTKHGAVYLGRVLTKELDNLQRLKGL